MLHTDSQIQTFRDGLMRTQLHIGTIYIKSLYTYRITPSPITPLDLSEILVRIEDKLISQPRLTLATGPMDYIWQFYEFLEIKSIMTKETLIIALYMPPVDISPINNVYNIFNLTIVHPTLSVVFWYVVESEYLDITEHLMFYGIPLEININAYMGTKVIFCRLNTALYSLDKSNLCKIA